MNISEHSIYIKTYWKTCKDILSYLLMFKKNWLLYVKYAWENSLLYVKWIKIRRRERKRDKKNVSVYSFR